MGERADIFLSTFNRIEKELKRQLGNPVNMSFSEAVRRLSKRRDNLIGDSENDLLQLAQLRNAIVHDQVADDFVIAEPNDWAVTRIKQIEESLLRPEKVLPRFGKKVTGFERNLPLVEIMKIITEKRFSQFPVYDSGKFMGLITLRTIGFYFAQASLSGSVSLKGRIAEDLLLGNGKRTNFKLINLWLRTADRVKIIVGEFDAFTFDELFEKVKAIAWEDYLPMDAEFPVAGRSIKSKLYSVPDCQSITKKAIVERLREVYHRPARVPLPETGALFQLEVALLKDHVVLTLDTTGPSLFKRGYRLEKGGAPLKENMAAALVMLTNWRKDRPFYDPVCGSGTLCIEAALIGHNIAPGFNRDFACEAWDWFDAAVFDKVRSAADEVADYDIELDIAGSDINGRMIEIAQANAEEIGLGDSIQLIYYM